MTIDDSESEDENHLVGNRYNNDDSDTDSEIDFYNLPSVGTKRLVLLLIWTLVVQDIPQGGTILKDFRKISTE